MEEGKDTCKDCRCQQIFEDCDTLGEINCSINVLRKIGECLKKNRWNKSLSFKFLKIRHNLFADCYMADNMIEIRNTDYSLRNLGIDSDLTPDVYLGEKMGIHRFIEFFVSNNPEIAIQNKKEKYSKFKSFGVEVSYIYFDMRTMMCLSEPEQEFREEYNIPIFESLMKRMVKIDRYLTYDSNELDIECITPGKSYECVPQKIYYYPKYREYSEEEYSRYVGKLVNELSELPEENTYSIHFDCEKRKFYIDRGSKDAYWLIKALRDREIFREIVIYENFEDACAEYSDDEGNIEEEDEYDNEDHKLRMKGYSSYHQCLECAIKPVDLYKSLKNLEFEGLYSKKMTCDSVSEDARLFYEEWLEKCRGVLCPKIKMTTMIALPDPDNIDKRLEKDVLMKCTKGWLKMAISKISFENMGGFDKNRIERNPKIDKYITEKYLLVENYENRMKTLRKEMVKISGMNDMSYRIKVISDYLRQKIRENAGSKIETLAEDPEFKYKFSLNSLEREYFQIHLKKISCMRQTRRIMKEKVSRENMFTMDKTMYALYLEEKNIHLKKRKKGEERMGIYYFDKEEPLESVESVFKDFWEFLTCESSFFDDWFEIECTEKSFPESVAGEQCKDYYSFYKVAKEKIKRTRIYRIILWISNLCRSIWAISTYKTKKRRVIFDRFGTRGCLLFVSSTGNIQKNKSSKAFKLLIPICKNTAQFCGYDKMNGYKIYKDDKLNEYLETHWAYLKIQHLKYFMELPGRWLQTVICVMSEYGISSLTDSFYMYITYCMLNARRKNENILHDLKYMTYNMFGIRGCYSDLLSDKFEIPRDPLERYIEEKFLRNIPKFMETLKHNNLLSISPVGNYPGYRLQHPLSNRETGLDSFNLFVYSSYCFPKGVFTHDIEQCINMESIMSIHKKAMDTLADSKDYYTVKEETDKPIDQIFSSDLYYNSSVVSAVGLFCEHFISSRSDSSDIRGSWAKIINRDVTDYANSHGLRENDLSQSKSWGKKGHDVMTAMISRECSEFDTNFLEQMNPQTIKEISKCQWEIIGSRYRIRDYAKNHPLERIELNNANKVQWGGSREIYIMTIGAKNIQWALEQMFAQISRCIDNEFIHIPAAERFGRLYNKIKSPCEGVRYYLTLDCRKWAPLSNLNKYVVFMNSMQGILPEEFVRDFNYFYHIYYEKRLFFKKSDVEKFLSYEKNKIYTEYFKESGCAYYITMPYSFMMGMFNYLSSILHAISQRYFKENIVPLIARDKKCRIKFQMFAHSDDSGGYVEISESEDPESVLDEVLKEYESFQKCLNHMLSLKKCTVGTSYFEITSYCFMKTDPMPVLSKFIYGHQINLTPSGYFSDVKSISSAIVEMIANGASFRTGFIKYILLGNTYRKFCIGMNINDSDSQLSLNLGGFPLIHPFYLCIYRSLAERKWISEFNNGSAYRNDKIMNDVGMIDSWGVCRGLRVRMMTMKNRPNDGRFSKYETLSEVPDDIIPSGHFACYMRKMSSKYYKDMMWYSMHDIDGTIIQSNMFNKGIGQIYNFLGEDKTIIEVISISKSFLYSEDISIKEVPFPEYIEEIDRNISVNKNVSYLPSDVRSKPSEINTYYNNWWRGKTREMKIMCLVKLCPWMGLLSSGTLEYMDCLESSKYVELSDIMKNLTEEEPLMKYVLTTKAESRLMDRFDTIASWIFHNSYSNMRPERTKRIEYRHGGELKKFHSECMASLLFEAVSSGQVKREADIQITDYDEKKEVKTIYPVVSWLRSKICTTAIHKIVIGVNPSEWLNSVDFICLKDNQYSILGRYWIGRTECICRIEGRSYTLIVKNGAISEIRCKARYDFDAIDSDMRMIDRFGFRYSKNVSPHKMKRIMRITQDADRRWHWDEQNLGMAYITNIKLDESIVTQNRLKYVHSTQSDIYKRETSDWANFKLMFENGQEQYKAYILNKKPCERCTRACTYCGNSFFVGADTEYSVNLTKSEMLEKWRMSETYKLLYKEKMKYEYLFSESSQFMGQIGTYLSISYLGEGKIGDQNYFTNLRGELMLKTMLTHEYDPRYINDIKSHLSKYIIFRTKGDRVVPSVNKEKIKSVLNEYGIESVSTALVLLPIERTMDYYRPMSYDNYWYNNTQRMPEFMENFLRYIHSTLSKQQGTMQSKKKRFRELLEEIPHYLIYSYQRMIQNSYMASIPVSLRILSLLRSFRDVGDPGNDEIDKRFYYSAESVFGCIAGWMRYILVYTYRRSGVLDPDHKNGYKKECSAFLRKYKSMCQTEFQIGINCNLSNIYRTLNAPPYELDKMNPEKRAYPLRECELYDFTTDERWFDDELMTYSRDESMSSFEYNERSDYDFSNESIFHEDGYRKRIRMCSDLDADNWVEVDRENHIYELKRGAGRNNVTISGGSFKIGGSSEFSESEYRDILRNIKKQPEKSDNETLGDYMLSKLSEAERKTLENTEMVKNVAGKLRVRVNLIESMLSKFSIFKQVFDEDGDITHIMEKENYDNITNLSNPLNTGLFSKRSKAELEMICPGIISVMMTNHFRMTSTQIEQYEMLGRATEFDDPTLEETYWLIHRTASEVPNHDQFCVMTADMMLTVLKNLGKITDQHRDKTLPEPLYDKELPYIVKIGI